MGPVMLTPEVEEVVLVLKEKISSAPVLVFPDFNKHFLLETDAPKEALGAVLSQKQDNGCYHPVVFGSRMLMPSKQNYHSLKLEFLTLKWSITEHFKEYLAYYSVYGQQSTNISADNTKPGCYQTPLVGALVSYEFTLEYQKRSDNAVADMLS